MILNRANAARVSTIQIIFKPPQYLEHGIVSRRELMAEPLFNRLESSGPDRQPACQNEWDAWAGERDSEDADDDQHRCHFRRQGFGLKR